MGNGRTAEELRHGQVVQRMMLFFQTSKTEKITGRNWLDSRVTEGGSRGIFGPDTCSFQCHFGVRAHS